MAAETKDPVYEPAEITRPWLVSAAVLGFILFAIVLMAILYAIYSHVAPRPQIPEAFPKPELQPHPQADFKTYMRDQQAEIQRSGWIDKSSGVAAIPVDKAMRIVAGRGPAAFNPLPEAQATPPRQGQGQ